MALTSKGKKVLRAMKKYYKDEDKAESVFYAMKKKGKLSGTEEIDNNLGKWKPKGKKPKGKK